MSRGRRGAIARNGLVNHDAPPRWLHPLRAHVPGAPGSAPQRIGSRTPHRDGLGQSISSQAVPSPLRRTVSGSGRGAGHRLCGVKRHQPCGHPVCARRAGLGQGQHGALSPPAVTDPRRSVPLPFCEGHRAGARISGSDLGRVPANGARNKFDARLKDSKGKTGQIMCYINQTS
jgi:hypothetical protein